MMEPLPGAYDPIRRLRWASANASGLLVSGPGVLYVARLGTYVNGVTEVVVLLRDHTTDVTSAENLLLPLHIAGSVASDDWPKAPVALRFQRGITAQFVVGASSGVILIGWDVV